MRLVVKFVVSMVVGLAASRRPGPRVWTVRGGAVESSSKNFGGLANQGNTCYLNALLQTLFHLRAFREGVLDSVVVRKRLFWRRRRPPREALARIFGQLSRNRTASTRELTRALGVDPNEQQDAQEYLRLLLDQVDEVATEVYGGEAASVLQVTPDEAEEIGKNLTSVKVTKFLDVSLEVRPTLKEAVAAALEPELLGDKWKTPEDGYRSATKAWTVKKLPGALVFHLKRFAFDGTTVAKIGEPLDVPLEFQGYFDDEVYRLHAVIVHVGSAREGHYYAFVDPQLDGTWFKFDDAAVDKVDVDDVLKQAKGTKGPSGTSLGGYLLQYVKVDNVCPPKKTDDDHISVKSEDDDEELDVVEEEDDDETPEREKSEESADSDEEKKEPASPAEDEATDDEDAKAAA